MLGSITSGLVAENFISREKAQRVISRILRCRLTKSVFVLTLVILVVGCNSIGRQNHTNNTEEGDSVAQLDSIHRQETFLLDIDNDKQRLYVDVSFVWPKGESTLASSLASMILADSLAHDSVEVIVGRFLSHIKQDYQSYFTESKSTEEEPELGNGPLALQIHTKNVYDSKDFISFESRYLMSKSSSDSSRSTLYCCLDRQTGRRLTMSDLFIDGSTEELARNQLHALMAQLGVNNTQELESTHWIYASELGLNTNFYLDEKDFVFLYNSYELSPLIDKAIEIRIPYTQLATLVRESGPLGWLRQGNTSESTSY